MSKVPGLIQDRLDKIAELRRKGISPYGSRFKDRTLAIVLHDSFTPDQKVKMAGRLVAKRGHGKAMFADLRDESAKIQLYVKTDIVGEELFGLFAHIDIGDFIGVEGRVFKSKMGEITVEVHTFQILTKSLRPLPEKWHGLKDVEVRYRQRYLDLIANDEVRKVFRLRSQIISEIRRILIEKGFLEVETPMMQAIPGGARAEPFKTHHNALDMDLFLRVAPELYLKRLLIGGFEKVFELNRNFRNEGISVRHNPEFTMIEIYEAYADYTDMMDLTEELFTSAAQKIHGTLKLSYGERTLDLTRPWKRIRFYEELNKKSGLDWQTGDIRKLAKQTKLDIDPALPEIDILNEAFGHFVEGDLFEPTFVLDYPAVTTPLAKRHENNEKLVYRFELFAAGMELANAFSELNDPVEQRSRMEAQKLDENGKVLDEDFLAAMEYGMPPAGGLGIGIDRLVMILTNQQSIRDVILFPHMRPQQELQEPSE